MLDQAGTEWLRDALPCGQRLRHHVLVLRHRTDVRRVGFRVRDYYHTMKSLRGLERGPEIAQTGIEMTTRYLRDTDCKNFRVATATPSVIHAVLLHELGHQVRGAAKGRSMAGVEISGDTDHYATITMFRPDTDNPAGDIVYQSSRRDVIDDISTECCKVGRRVKIEVDAPDEDEPHGSYMLRVWLDS